MLDPLSGVQVVISAQRKVRQPEPKPFTAYQLSVYCGAAFSHVVEKRYSDFEKLHRLLRAASSPGRHCRLPDLPAKLLTGAPDDRRRDLEAYANTVLVCFQHSRAPACVSLLCKFLHIEHRSPTHSSSDSGCSGAAFTTTTSRPELDWQLQLLTPQRGQAAASVKGNQQQQQQQHQHSNYSHASVVRMPEVELVPRAELDLLTYTVVDTVYQSSGSSSVDD